MIIPTSLPYLSLVLVLASSLRTVSSGLVACLAVLVESLPLGIGG